MRTAPERRGIGSLVGEMAGQGPMPISEAHTACEPCFDKHALSKGEGHVLSKGEGHVLSKGEGHVLSKGEGHVLSKVEGLSTSGVRLDFIVLFPAHPEP